MRSRASLLTAACLAGLLVVGPVPADAADGDLSLVPTPGSTVEFERGTYAGRLDLRVAADGLALVEDTDLDIYLAGIREVPASWPSEALAAQAVAARTYLAWTLARGRAGAGVTYGFDICATTACQVYRGVAPGAEAASWVAAVGRTSDEILLYDGAPAQTLYSSSSGRRTRSVQDVFGGSARPYLQAVDSPEAGVSPYTEWTLDVDAEVFVRVLREAGYRLPGELEDVDVVSRDDGAGPWVTRITMSEGIVRIPNADFRWVVSNAGPRLYPGLFPGARPSGGRWPQAVLSYTYDASYRPGTDVAPGLSGRLPVDDIPSVGRVVVTGTGWGHGVGMSQWGAYAMASDGAGYEEILSHYYGGLEPQAVPGVLPDTVSIGLAWGRREIELDVAGSLVVRSGGQPIAVLPAGRWTFAHVGNGIAVVDGPTPPPSVLAGPRRPL